MRSHVIIGIASVTALLALFYVGSLSPTGAVATCPFYYSTESGKYMQMCGLEVVPRPTFEANPGAILFTPSDVQTGNRFEPGEGLMRRQTRYATRLSVANNVGKKSWELRGEEGNTFDPQGWASRSRSRAAYIVTE